MLVWCFDLLIVGGVGQLLVGFGLGGGTLLIHLVCRCDFLCSKAVVQFVCWGVCVFWYWGGLGCFRVGDG